MNVSSPESRSPGGTATASDTAAPPSRQAALSFAQTRLWFLDQFQPGNPMYNVPLVLRLPGPLKVDVVERALNEIVKRHESLRTRFVLIDRLPRQLIAASLSLTLKSIDLQSTPAASREGEAQAITFEESRTPFDLAVGPLIRATLIELSPTDHVLVLVIHHIVCDGWSMAIIYRELSTLYAAYVSGRPSPLPPVSVQYADFASWQAGWLTGAVLDKQLSYWRQQLEGLKPLMALPLDRPRPPVQAHRGAIHRFSLDAALCDRVKALGQSERATLFMTLLAAFDVLLHRYTGELDIVVGSPIANRTRPDLEGVVGFFVNTLLMRVDLSGDPPFRELLRRVRGTALDAYAHQDIPFEKLVEEIQPERNPAHNPLFQALFAVQNIAPPTRGGAQQAAPPLAVPVGDNGTSKFDLTVTLFDTGRTVDGAVEYNVDLFDPQTIAVLIERYEVLLRGVIDDPDRRIGALPVARVAELTAADGWSGSPAVPAAHRSIHDAVRAAAMAAGATPAVIDETSTISYGELDTRASQLARRLRHGGLVDDDIVAVALGRSAETIVALLAVMKAGGVFVAIDPLEPRPRVERILQDASPRFLITDATFDIPVRENATHVVNLDRERAALSAFDPGEEEGPNRSGRAACLAYRSSPSGRLDGVMVGHDALLRMACGPTLQLTPADRVAHVSSLLDDASLVEIFGALTAGATVVCLPVGLPPRTLAERIRDRRITVLLASCKGAERLAREFPWAFGHLRMVLCTDEASIHPSVQRDVRERLQPVFGAIECGGFYAARPFLESTAGEGDRAIGHPSPGVTVHLLDGQLLPVPDGMCGEICVASPALALGYRGAADRTAATFVRNPFGDTPALLCRTGEFARRTPDGVLAHLGRRDGRCVIQGVRVERQEIEAVLREHPQVANAAVVVDRENGRAKNPLTAFLVGGGAGGSLSPQDVRAYLEEHLPRAIVPAAITIIDRLPEAAGGAVDHGALLRQVRSADRAATEPPPYRAPRTPLEQRIADIWAQVFGLERVGIDDDFFQLGGHSLLATQVAARLSHELETDVPLQQLFDAPTIAGTAAILEPHIGSTHTLDVPPLVRVPRDRPIPLSFAQQRLWFLDRFEPGTALYNIAVNRTLPPSANIASIDWSLNELVRRHESLRTVCQTVDGEPVQVILPSMRIELPISDVSALPPGAREAEAARLGTIEAQAPFNLETGPLFRARILTLGDAGHVLLITMHHIVADGWSMDILFRELGTFYDASCAGRDAALPPLDIQYADFAVWQRKRLAGPIFDQQRAYWKQALAGAPAVLELPTDHPRPPVQAFRGSSHTFALPLALFQAVKALAERERVTVFMTLLAAFDALLYRYTGATDIVVGTPIANRTRPELEPLIGFFANTLPLRVRIAPGMGFRDLLAQVREVTLAAHAHQDVPFETVVDDLQPERNLSYNPIFQVMVANQSAIGPRPAATDATHDGPALAINTGIAKFDLTMFLTDTASGVQVGFEYNRDLFEAETIESLAGSFQTLLTAATADHERPLSALPLLTAADTQVLQSWNTSASPYDAACIHRLFESQAEATPDQIAVRLGGDAITYRDLNALANAGARRLMALGVGPDTLVAIALDRSIHMIAALLSTLKAGGAYLPLDPALPRDRIAAILADAQPRAILTTATAQARLPSTAAPVLLVESLPETADAAGTVDAGVTPDHLAYVLYTSGSTGVPKGVAMPHRALANLFQWQIRRSGLSPAAPTLQNASLGFDVSCQEIFTTLGAGGTLVLIHDDDRRDPGALWRVIGTQRIQRLFLPYVLLQQLADRAARMTALPDTLVEVITAGEQLQITPPIAALFARLGCPLHNQYGPTETHVATELSLTGNSHDWPVRPSIGRPIPNVTIHILDDDGDLVPIGVPGEIHIGGVALARGYLNDPDRTAARFITAAPGTVNGPARLYKTGDRGRFRRDGTIEFLGRSDQQVKIRGIRVEPAEVEIALRRHVAVREAAVVPRDDAGQITLAAYVHFDPAATVSGRDLRAFLSTSLPEHMLPSVFVSVASLPLTPSGKLDRRALPAVADGSMAEPPRSPEPRTPVEAVVAKIWCELLHVPRVGVLDNFFELGGHSLLATRMLARIEDTLGVDLPVRRVFEAPTVEGLAVAIVTAQLENQEEGAIANLLADLEAMPEATPPGGLPEQPA